MKTFLSRLISPMGLLMIAATAVAVYVHTLQRKVAALNTEADSLAVEVLNKDALLAESERMSDSLETRLAYQAQIARTALDSLAGIDSIMASGETVVTIAGEISDTTVVHDDSTYTISNDKPPLYFTLTLTTEEPPRYEMRWAIEPVTLTVRVGCQATQGRASRGLLAIRSPDWVDITVGATTFDPAVCNPSITLPQQRKGPSWWVIPATAAAGYLAAEVTGGNGLAGAAVGGGVGILFKLTF